MVQNSRSDLQKLGTLHRTVKSHPALGYLPLYEHLMGTRRNHSFELMELGAGPLRTIGASFFMWRDYFPNAKIIGVDNKSEASSIKDASGRIKVEVGNLGSDDFLQYLAKTYTPEIIVDDASHFWVHQVTSFEALFPSLKSGGIYVIEDVHTSYGELRKTYGGYPQDAFSYFSTISNLVCGRKEEHHLLTTTPATSKQIELSDKVDYIMFARRLIVLFKI